MKSFFNTIVTEVSELWESDVEHIFTEVTPSQSAFQMVSAGPTYRYLATVAMFKTSD